MRFRDSLYRLKTDRARELINKINEKLRIENYD